MNFDFDEEEVQLKLHQEVTFVNSYKNDGLMHNKKNNSNSNNSNSNNNDISFVFQVTNDAAGGDNSGCNLGERGSNNSNNNNNNNNNNACPFIRTNLLGEEKGDINESVYSYSYAEDSPLATAAMEGTNIFNSTTTNNNNSNNNNNYNDNSNNKKVGIDDFELLKLIGKGGFGKVFQVRHKRTEKVYAMKVYRKDAVIKRNAAVYAQSERDILLAVSSHPFIISLYYAFQSDHKLYFVMEFLNGGQLFHMLRKETMFPESQARFYSAEMVLALDHLHSLGIIHRDLKPENILLNSEGHVILTDFGLAKADIDDDNRTRSFCGTEEYMAPEMIDRVPYGKEVDWWALGALLFDMLTGGAPFQSENRNNLYKLIRTGKAKYPTYMTGDCVALIKGLLTKDPNQRFDVTQVKKSNFYKSISWKKVLAREITPPFRPKVNDNLDVSNFDTHYTNEVPSDSPASYANNVFQGFSYINANIVAEMEKEKEKKKQLEISKLRDFLNINHDNSEEPTKNATMAAIPSSTPAAITITSNTTPATTNVSTTNEAKKESNFTISLKGIVSNSDAVEINNNNSNNDIHNNNNNDFSDSDFDGNSVKSGASFSSNSSPITSISRHEALTTTTTAATDQPPKSSSTTTTTTTTKTTTTANNNNNININMNPFAEEFVPMGIEIPMIKTHNNINNNHNNHNHNHNNHWHTQQSNNNQHHHNYHHHNHIRSKNIGISNNNNNNSNSNSNNSGFEMSSNRSSPITIKQPSRK